MFPQYCNKIVRIAKLESILTSVYVKNNTSLKSRSSFSLPERPERL